MPLTIQHNAEPTSNVTREATAKFEPNALRTFTPTQAVIASSAGVFHWTPEGRRLYDFTSGVLVSNLGHNPSRWMSRFTEYMGWPFPDGRTLSPHPEVCKNSLSAPVAPDGYFLAVPMTAYNAVTPVEIAATQRLVATLRGREGGGRMEQVMWAASGSEAIQKALWAAAARDRSRSMILATRFGFHGKKGLANAVTGSESDAERDPRVRFMTFPTTECRDICLRDRPFDPRPYQSELDALLHQFGRKLGSLITEPYLGGGGSYHPPKAYLQLLERFCRANDIVFILDEVQSNFGRTGRLFAYETYGLEPDIVVLGKGLGNGVPVAAAVGRSDVFGSLGYGEASDTWSANPLQCAAVLATLDEYEAQDVIAQMPIASEIIEQGLIGLQTMPFVAHVRGERGGMVWGVEMQDHAGRTAAEWANAFVLASYLGDTPEGEGVHLLGPLSKKVVRISPPLTITPLEATKAIDLLTRSAHRLLGSAASSSLLAG